VIRSFRCSDTARLFDDHPVRRFQEVERIARRKLLYLDATGRLEELRVPPGNRLEQLKRDRARTYAKPAVSSAF
jgi:proteic killer suppression protein